MKDEGNSSSLDVRVAQERLFKKIEDKYVTNADRKDFLMNLIRNKFPDDIKQQEEINLSTLNYKLYKVYSLLTDTEREYLNDLNVDVNKSYFVIGHDKTQLDKFLSYFLLKGSFISDPIQVSEFVEQEMHKYAISGEDLGRGRSNLPVIYIHHNLELIGRQTDLYISKVVSYVATRNREDRLTLILSEMDMATLRESGEVEVIRLDYNRLKPSTVRSVLKSINKVETSDDTGNQKLFGETTQRAAVGKNRPGDD